METDALALSLTYQFGTNAAFLFLAALGLIVILGMMNIINLAHGELMMMGAYVATITHNQLNLPFPLAVIVSFFAVAIFGAILELLIVRRFYGRELGALVVTWGISLILGQGTLLVFGPFMPAIKIPGGKTTQCSATHGKIPHEFIGNHTRGDSLYKGITEKHTTQNQGEVRPGTGNR